MISETAKQSNYRYLISLDVLIPDKDPISIDSTYISSILIEKDYDNAFFPIFCLTTFFETETYYLIMENRTTVKFRVKMEKYVAPNDENNAIKYKELVFNDIFTTYIQDNDANIYKDRIKLAESGNNDGTTQKGISYDLYLFKENDMKASRTMINTIIKSANMTDVITFLLSKSGTKKVLMAPLQNIENYNEILLLPTTVIQNMIYLEKQYGFYNNGSIFFYDLDTVYLIPKTGLCSAYRPGEFQTTIFTQYKSNNALTAIPGSYKDKVNKTNIIHISNDNIYFKSASIVDEQITGSTLSIIDPLTNNIESITPDVDNKKTKNTKVIVNNFSNKFFSSMIENQKIEDDNVISALIYDFDIDALSPNKKFVLSFEDTEIQKKYGGNYRMCLSKMVFNKKGESYDANAYITIKRSI